MASKRRRPIRCGNCNEVLTARIARKRKHPIVERAALASTFTEEIKRLERRRIADWLDERASLYGFSGALVMRRLARMLRRWK